MNGIQMDFAVIAALIAAGVSLVIAIVGWVSARTQDERNRRRFEQDIVRERRQRDIDRVLSYLEEYAVLAALYRSLARSENHLVLDADNRPVRDATGDFQVIEREVFPDEALEDIRIELEGKDIRGSIKLQGYRLSQSTGQIRDLLDDLDPSGEAETQFGLLYHFTVEGLRQALESGKFWRLLDAVGDVDNRRTELRTLVRGLVDISQ